MRRIEDGNGGVRLGDYGIDVLIVGVGNLLLIERNRLEAMVMFP